MKTKLEALYGDFTTKYPFITIDRSTVAQFYKEYNSTNVDMLFDYVLAQGLDDDIEI